MARRRASREVGRRGEDVGWRGGGEVVESGLWVFAIGTPLRRVGWDMGLGVIGFLEKE